MMHIINWFFSQVQSNPKRPKWMSLFRSRSQARYWQYCLILFLVFGVHFLSDCWVLNFDFWIIRTNKMEKLFAHKLGQVLRTFNKILQSHNHLPAAMVLLYLGGPLCQGGLTQILMCLSIPPVSLCCLLRGVITVQSVK
jgi:hypothetical protein